MSAISTIYNIFKFVSENGDKAERGPTIGSFWTVDRWTLGDVTVRLEDEGYTKTIRSPLVQVSDSGGKLIWYRGDEEYLEALAKELGV